MIVDVVDVLLPSSIEGKNDVEKGVICSLPEQKIEKSVLQEENVVQNLLVKEENITLQENVVVQQILEEKAIDLIQKSTEQLISEFVEYKANLAFPLYLESLQQAYNLLSQAIKVLQFNDEDLIFYAFSVNLENFLRILSSLLILFFNGGCPFSDFPWIFLENEEILRSIESLNIHFNDWWNIVESFLRGVYIHAKKTIPNQNLSGIIERFWGDLKKCYVPSDWKEETVDSYFKTHSSIYEKFYFNAPSPLQLKMARNWGNISLPGSKHKSVKVFRITSIFSIMVHEKGAYVCSEIAKFLSFLSKYKN